MKWLAVIVALALATPVWAGNDEMPTTSTLDAQLKCREWGEQQGPYIGPAVHFESAFYSRKADTCFFRFSYPHNSPSLRGPRWVFGDELRDGINPSLDTTTYTAVQEDGTWHCSANVKTITGGCPKSLNDYIRGLR
jgi:hypothetical protein